MKNKMKIEKARLDLVPPESLYGMAMAFEDGANKRSAHNWEVGEDSQEWSFEDRLAAIMRHVNLLRMGDDLATDSGIHHAAHIMANAAMLYTAFVRGDIGDDDRIL